MDERRVTYRGMVVDRLADDPHRNRIRYTSRPCVTWEEAQRRAEERARRQWAGCRYAVVVEVVVVTD